MQVHSENVSSFLNGRVIKLGLTCVPSNGKPCLIFKLNGSVSCKLKSLNVVVLLLYELFKKKYLLI